MPQEEKEEEGGREKEEGAEEAEKEEKEEALKVRSPYPAEREWADAAAFSCRPSSGKTRCLSVISLVRIAGLADSFRRGPGSGGGSGGLVAGLKSIGPAPRVAVDAQVCRGTRTSNRMM